MMLAAVDDALVWPVLPFVCRRWGGAMTELGGTGEVKDYADQLAQKGLLRLLQWARQNGAPWNATCAKAAGGGHLEVLQWARQNGCPWNEYTCAYAAGGGHLEVLQWARQNGCPWNENTCA